MKRLKKILKIFFISIIILILLGIGFTFLFGDKIEEIILNKINSKLKKELSLSEIEFSLFENFPDASVTFSNILIQESFQNSSDTLLFAEEGIIKLNILNVISQDYSVNDVEFNKGVINIKYNENGDPNFDILKDNDEENNNFELNNLNLSNSRFTFSDEVEKIYTSSEIDNINLSLTKEDEKFICNLNGSLRNDSLVVDEVDYINNKNVSFNSEIEISDDSIFITSTNLSIGGVDFKNLNFDYSKLSSEYLLTTETENADISNVIFATPKEYQYLYEDHEISGKISAKVEIRKDTNFANPYSEIDFKLNNCKYKSKTQPFELENIYSDCHFDNDSTKRNFDFTQFRFSNFKSSKKGGDFNADFTLTNLNKYYLNVEMFSSWELRELNDFIEDSPFKNMKGTVSGFINYHGNLSFDSKMSGYFANSTHTADLNFKDVYLNYKESELDFVFGKMNWEVDNHNVKISKNKFSVSQSELSFNGNIDNLILYILNEEEKININGKLASDKMIFEELFTITELSSEKEGGVFIGPPNLSVLPTWLDVNISINVKEFWYNNFTSSDFTTDVNYDSKNLKLTADEIDMQTLDGSISGDVIYFENKLHDLVLKSNLDVNKINISDGFKSFDNFNQTFITNKNINGIATANIYLQAMWDKNYKFYSPSLHMSSQLRIENGELIEFKPMYNLSDYVSLEELKEVKFATLKNKIRIENEKIIIPEMDIHSTALSVHVSGEHSFANIMDYKVSLLLSDVLGNKVKESMSLEEIEHNHEGKTTIQLKMSGHVDDPKITLDKVQLKEDIVNEIIEEGEEVIKIIENKILNKEDPDTKEEKEKEEELDIEIEWDDKNPKK
ncbi:MAG: hypothetical protein HOB15_03755 [Flavobacteriales bacterium]|nr:hypothetical protein [Flavobacteriales bacterium]